MDLDPAQMTAKHRMMQLHITPLWTVLEVDLLCQCLSPDRLRSLGGASSNSSASQLPLVDICLLVVLSYLHEPTESIGGGGTGGY